MKTKHIEPVQIHTHVSTLCTTACTPQSHVDGDAAPGMQSYPEHEKLATIGDKSQACGEFMEWLQQRYTIAEYHVHHPTGCYVGVTRTCGTSDQVLYTASINLRELLAEFFEIDKAKLEAEKRAMLALQAARHTSMR